MNLILNTSDEFDYETPEEKRMNRIKEKKEKKLDKDKEIKTNLYIMATQIAVMQDTIHKLMKMMKMDDDV